MTNKEAIIQLTERTNIYGFTDEDNEALDLAIKALEEKPTGKWLDVYSTHIAYECSNCHRQMPIHDFYFCPNCGAYMWGDKNVS